MQISEVHDYYWRNWANAMRQLGLSRNAHHYWIRKGYIPIATQLKIEKITNSDLKADVTIAAEEKRQKKVIRHE